MEEKKILNLNSGNCQITQKEREHFKGKIIEKYKRLHGKYDYKDFKTSNRNFKDLKNIMKFEFEKSLRQTEIYIDNDQQNIEHIIPGVKFLKDLFTCKVESKPHRRTNIDMICYFLSQEKLEDYKGKHPEVFPNYQPFQSIVINYIDKNRDEALEIKTELEDKLSCTITLNECNTPVKSIGDFNYLYEKFEDCLIFTLISGDFFQEESTLIEYFKFIESNTELYWEKTIHLILPHPKQSDEYRLLLPDGHSEIIRFWNNRLKKYQIQLSEQKNSPDGYLSQNSNQLIEKQIADTFQATSFITPFIALLNNNQTIVKRKDINSLESYDQLKTMLMIKKVSTKKNIYENIYTKIISPSENNPAKPEFPPIPYYDPKFPASKIEERIIYDNKVYFVNENNNPTGTHKDRFAWEVIVFCKSQMQSGQKLPDFSLISSGSAAIAVQHMFNLFKIPAKLKVLVDENIDISMETYLKNIGCKVYKHRLEFEQLDSEKIKWYTNNNNGIDITYREILDPMYSHYYDWYSYEIINIGFDYCFIPYGTGDLFSNILTIYKNEYMRRINNQLHDPRFYLGFDPFNNPIFYGISTMDENSLMTKLYSSYRPAQTQHRKLIHDLVNKFKCIGKETSIIDHVEEEFVHEAIDMADNLEIEAEPSALAGLAQYLKTHKEIPKDKKVLIVNTGKTKTWDQIKTFYDENKIILKNS